MTEAQPSAPARRLPPRRALLELPRSALYLFIRTLVAFLLTVIYRFRRFGADRIPSTGPCLVVANHASHFDPPILSCCISGRQANYLARQSLFKYGPWGWFIRALRASPIRDNSGDIGAIRAILNHLDQGQVVVVFPEGARTYDGNLQPFKRGIALLLKRSSCPVVPVAIQGAFEAFPRQQRFPSMRGQRIAALVGHPIEHDDLLANGPDAALTRLANEIEQLRQELRQKTRD